MLRQEGLSVDGEAREGGGNLVLICQCFIFNNHSLSLFFV